MTLIEALRIQAEACSNLGSPFMGRLLTGLAETWKSDGALAEFCAKFSGDIGPSGASLPLRLAGALHAVVLTGRDDDLRAVYPPVNVDDATLIETVWQTIDRHTDFVIGWMGSAPQTNEVRRSAVMIAGAHFLAARHDLPFVTSELGASAGLNLGWDRYALTTPSGTFGPSDPVLTLSPDWQGAATPVQSAPRVVQRRGVDLNPLDPSDPDQALRLMSYIWPDQPHRMELTRAAIAARRDAVDRADAVDWLRTRLEAVPDGRLHMIYNTIAWQYFPAERQETGTALIEAAGAKATPNAPLAWLAFEADGATPGASMMLRMWPGDLRIRLGRADFHGRWVHWDPVQLT